MVAQLHSSFGVSSVVCVLCECLRSGFVGQNVRLFDSMEA